MKTWQIAAIGIGLCAPVFGQTLTIDPAFSDVGFLVGNFGIHSVQGRFSQFTGKIEFDPQYPEKSTVHVAIQAASIDTQNAHRDKHLRTPDFFDAVKYPELSFESQSVEKKPEGYVLNGNLTIKGQTHPVVIPFSFTTTSANGKTVLRAQGKTQINRHEYGIDYGNNFTVGKTVTIRLSVSASE